MASDASIDELDGDEHYRDDEALSREDGQIEEGSAPVPAPLMDEALPPVLADELGEDLVEILSRARRAQEAWERDRRPDEGLRERKKRLMRRRISDVATAMFMSRGFERVRVTDVAEVVGVSEKTIYNYFPTKESMVFDTADEGVQRLAAALRARVPGESPTKAVVAEIKRDIEHLELVLGDDADKMLPVFAEMVASTPALRAALRGIQERLVAVAADELAHAARVDPRDP